MTLSGNTTFDIPAKQPPRAPERAAIADLNDVLAVRIDDVKR